MALKMPLMEELIELVVHYRFQLCHLAGSRSDSGSDSGLAFFMLTEVVVL